MDKSTKKKINAGIDYTAGAGAGSLASAAGYGVSKLMRGGILDPYYNPGMGDIAKKEFYNALKSKNSLFKRTLTAGAAGAILGAGAVALLRKQRKDVGKDPSLPVATKAVGLGSAALMGKYLHGNRGKIHLLRKGLLNDFDVWRPNGGGIKQFFKAEKWIPNKEFDQVANKKSIGSYHYDRVLKDKFTPTENMKNTKDAVLKSGKSVEEINRTIHNKKFGGDPEINFVIKGKKKSLPIQLATFPNDASRLHPNLTNDFSVLGGEINKLKPAFADEFVDNMHRITGEIKDKLKGSKVKIEPMAITPNKNDAYFSYNKKTAGGHVHANFDVPAGEDEHVYRERIAKRIALLTTPIDATHPAGYARFGLEKHNGTYGKHTMDKRSLNRTNWIPEGGFTDSKGTVIRSNMEIRNAPSYVEDEVALKKKLHLTNMAINHPDAHKLDAIADEVFSVTKNEARGMYHPDVRKHLSNKTLEVLNDMGVNDKWLTDVHSKYRTGNLRKIGA